MEDQNDMENKIMEFTMLQRSAESLKMKEEMFIRTLEEFKMAKQSLEEMKNEENKEALIPIGAGNFIEGKIVGTDKIIVGIGGGLAVKKSREGAVEHIDRKIKETEEMFERMTLEAHGLVNKMNKLQFEIENMQK